ncbi:MAG: hypothetical protein ACUZ8I_03525, partial [Candidatus Scalindua sp.]
MPFLSVKKYTLIIVFFATIIICPKFSVGYGYKRNEDPLITVFKSVIFHGKKNNWVRVESEIDSINDRIDDVNTIFDVDLKSTLDTSLAQHNLQEVIKVMANFVFLAIREKYYWNLTENLKMFERANVRLRIAEEYYTLLLSGNVRRYDKHNGTAFHDEIFNKFSEAKKSLGSTGFLGAGAVSPRPKEFKTITKEIEEKLLIVFP